MIVFFFNSALISVLNFAPVFIIFKIYNHALVTGSTYYLLIIFLVFIFSQLFLYQLEMHRKNYLNNYVASFKKIILNKIIKVKINTQNDRDKKLFDELAVLLNKDLEQKVTQSVDLLFAFIYVLLTIFIDYKFTLIMLSLSLVLFVLNLKVHQIALSISKINISVIEYFNDHLLKSHIKFNIANLKRKFKKSINFDSNLVKIEKIKIIKNIFLVSIYIFSTLLVILNNLNPVLIFMSAIILFRINAMMEHIHSLNDLFIFKIFFSIKKLKFNKIRVDKKNELKLNDSTAPLLIENLNLHYPQDNLLIQKFSYSFQPKSIYTISGFSGVGKTSFLKAICGLDNFSYKNIVLKHIPTYYYKQLFLDVIIFVPEYINLELRNYIDYVFGEKKYDLDCNFISTFNKNINLDQLFQNKIGISQAVYKLLYIVICLSKKPEVILLDEPSIKFNSTEFKIFSEVLKIMKVNKKIAIITSNDARVLNLASKKFFFNDSQNLSLVK